MKPLAGFALTLVLAAPVARAEGIAEVTVDQSTVHTKIEFANGVGADLTISFEKVLGIHSLGLSASLVDPGNIEIVNRMADPELITVPAAFPVLVAIQPPPNGPLSFSGVVTIELHTHDLSYTPNSPLRLFAADLGGSFYDMTSYSGQGSYRVGGSKGGFSEFLIVADLRPVTVVIDEKFTDLQCTLDANAGSIEPSVLDALQAHLSAAWSWYGAGDLQAASAEIDQFSAMVKQNSGSAIPATWRSAGDLVNVAGELRQEAGTLRFSLNLASSS